MHKLFWIPNIIGYLRFSLACYSYYFHTTERPVEFLIIIGFSFLLDGLDGYAARKLNQVSTFGTVLDVMLDLHARGLVWAIVSPGIGCLIIWWEWITFLSTRSLLGNNWKSPSNPPWIVHAVMRNGFKTLAGFCAIGSIFFLPMALYCQQYIKDETLSVVFMNSHRIQLSVHLFIIGRFMAFVVEGWYVLQYVRMLLSQE